jgi:hypothetical protein
MEGFKMCECEFEYGEELEFSHHADFRKVVISTSGYNYEYARRPLPKLRKGDWIIVFDRDGNEYARRFKRLVDGHDVICCIDGSKIKETGWRNGWKPM